MPERRVCREIEERVPSYRRFSGAGCRSAVARRDNYRRRLERKALPANGPRRTADQGKNHRKIRLPKRPAAWWGACPTDAGYWAAVGGAPQYFPRLICRNTSTTETAPDHLLSPHPCHHPSMKASGIGEVRTGGGPAGSQPTVTYKQSLCPTLLKHEV